MERLVERIERMTGHSIPCEGDEVLSDTFIPDM